MRTWFAYCFVSHGKSAFSDKSFNLARRIFEGLLSHLVDAVKQIKDPKIEACVRSMQSESVFGTTTHSCQRVVCVPSRYS